MKEKPSADVLARYALTNKGYVVCSVCRRCFAPRLRRGLLRRDSPWVSPVFHRNRGKKCDGTEKPAEGRTVKVAPRQK